MGGRTDSGITDSSSSYCSCVHFYPRIYDSSQQETDDVREEDASRSSAQQATQGSVKIGILYTYDPLRPSKEMIE